MPTETSPTLPIHAADVRDTVEDVIDHLAQISDGAWDLPAAGLDWSCRETAAHILDDLGGYAMQLSGERGHAKGYTPLVEPVRPRPDGPVFTFWPEEDGGTRAICECLDAVGGLLVAVVATAPADRIGWHNYGDSDRVGFAAMGAAETVLHAHDILTAQAVDYRPDDGVVSRVLDRIFPEATRTDDPWRDLLTATGRTPETRGKPWRWDSAVR
ncbi:MAG TPA: DinB family protein [Segeticoccus sp.]|uniref:maleylpyruvate isomerase N-terminal domain-containing protein n=1 Tax=Segeticoccus sp. TaxID=2706531 RepID=UPI002D7E70BC|nr:DinB family protein [Segeticoccus sp.]HET8599234.1 DinB family protein [Segeticoccus sp.]